MPRTTPAGWALYVIVDGLAKVVKGKIVTARAEDELGPGDFFGELALLDGGRHHSLFLMFNIPQMRALGMPIRSTCSRSTRNRRSSEDDDPG